jgi:hypothetical protein
MRGLVKRYVAERGEGCDVIITGLYSAVGIAEQVREPATDEVAGDLKQGFCCVKCSAPRQAH